MKRPFRIFLFIALLIAVALPVRLLAVHAAAHPFQYAYTVVNVYPHDRTAFTQGLDFDDEGVLYEGTGLWGRSSIRRVVLQTGAVEQIRPLPNTYFGEGIVVVGERLYQLTWQAHTGFIYDKTTFTPLASFSYPSEGWGLTYDGQSLIMSDGSDVLHFLAPDTLQETGQVHVTDDGGAVWRLNELEYVKGAVLANVWQTDRVAVIDPQNGRVKAWIDLSGLLSAEDRTPPVDVLNGIAYLKDEDRLFVTGKLWPKLFEIQVHPPSLLHIFLSWIQR
ncbi:MAG: glutaminyl-peptide cyclotransferase [Chloroflexi bacterium]|nr:glutaminyl-peptide cyclotransferase [Chloroflexota bacterium]